MTVTPIDIVIDIIKTRKNTLKQEHGEYDEYSFYGGQEAAYQELIDEFENFKKLFN